MGSGSGSTDTSTNPDSCPKARNVLSGIFSLSVGENGACSENSARLVHVTENGIRKYVFRSNETTYMIEISPDLKRYNLSTVRQGMIDEQPTRNFESRARSYDLIEPGLAGAVAFAIDDAQSLQHILDTARQEGVQSMAS